MTFDLRNLNPSQRDAVENTEGPMLVLAGAGSGKTRVLTYKIAYLSREKGVSPYHILAVTFTNKAAGEMKSRVKTFLKRSVSDLWIGTFHSICARILRMDGQRLGISPHFTIYDTIDQDALIRRAIEIRNIHRENLKVATVRHRISRAKNNLIGPEELAETTEGPLARDIGQIYMTYQDLLRRSGALDFDDLLAYPLQLFADHPDVLEKYQKRYSHILIDEYQDTNHAQYLFARYLSARHRNLTVVGDDDQAIYRWRGADIRNILQFEEDYPEARVIHLDRNYRSTEIILNAANNVAQGLATRREKNLWTEEKGGEKIIICDCGDELHEALRVVEKIKEHRDKHGLSLKEIAILYRTNAQSRPLEVAFRRYGIPYVIVGGLRFYERMEIKDILSYLRLLTNPDDTASFHRAARVPRRGIGETSLKKLEDFCESERLKLTDGLNRLDDIFPRNAGAKRRIHDFVSLLNELRELYEHTDLSSLTRTVIDRTGYIPYLEKSSPLPHDSRIDNIEEFIASMEQFEERAENPTLEGFLEEVSLMTDVDQWDDSQDAVTLMTLHSAKGLEFTFVFITGMEDGLFPLHRKDSTEEDLEEERRLCYVGITRAKRFLCLSFANFRRLFGTFTMRPSAFLKDIPENLIEREETGAFARGFHASREKKRITRVLEFEDYSQETERGDWSADQEAVPTEADDSSYPVGAHVRHFKWGTGLILEREGSGANLKLTVQFGNKRKKIMVKFAQLQTL